MAHIDVFKGWAETIRSDIEPFKALIESKAAAVPAKRLAGAALLYLVSRMDLVPDWNEGIGVIDDAMVLRVCARLAQGYELGALATSAQIGIDRMANEADHVTEFLGGASYAKLTAHCAKLADQTVRGRTTTQLYEDESARKAVYVEIENELEKSLPVVLKDPKDAELRLKSYLVHKLSA